MRNTAITHLAVAGTAALACASVVTHGSSHREAPMITSTPKLDCADFYLFNSYETGRSNYVTMVANYVPLQDAYGGPNYFTLDPNAFYEIHIDNNGDAREDLTFRFQFSSTSRDIALPIGPAGNQRTNAIPLIIAGGITAGNNGALNVLETYTVKLVRGDRRAGTVEDVSNAADGSKVFTKPVDNIGNKTLPDYAAYADSYSYAITIPGSTKQGRLFVGQRKDPFVVNLGETFDLINLKNPLGPVDGEKDSLYYKNVTSLILEAPTEWLTSGTSPVVAGWTTASMITAAGTNQVSRLGQPLVNEVVIGLRDKDKFNASEPKDDGQFADYVTHPTLPALVEILFGAAGVKAPTAFPRTDLVAVFLTGVAGLNANGSVCEMLRLNTSTPPVAAAQQNNLGVIAGDNAGFPNGRRPGDDVVDVALRVVMGKLLPAADAPSGQLAFTDGAYIDANYFSDKFPYLRAPLAGSPNDPSVTITLQSARQVEGAYANTPSVYDSATGRLTTPKTDPAGTFYRLKTDKAGVKLGGVASDAQNVSIGVLPR